MTYICAKVSDTRFFPEERFIGRKDNVQIPKEVLRVEVGGGDRDQK